MQKQTEIIDFSAETPNLIYGLNRKQIYHDRSPAIIQTSAQYTSSAREACTRTLNCS